MHVNIIATDALMHFASETLGIHIQEASFVFHCTAVVLLNPL